MNKSITLKSYDIFTLKVVVHVYYLTVRCEIDFIDGEGDGGLADRGGQGLKFSLNLSQIRLNT